VAIFKKKPIIDRCYVSKWMKKPWTSSFMPKLLNIFIKQTKNLGNFILYVEMNYNK
jgi:hypothetical protein